jgi:hypothetical protein
VHVDVGDTPGQGHAGAVNIRERGSLGHWRAVLPQMQAAGAGERARFRTAASGGNSDIPRDFMKVSVAAIVAVPAQHAVLTLSANSCPS